MNELEADAFELPGRTALLASAVQLIESIQNDFACSAEPDDDVCDCVHCRAHEWLRCHGLAAVVHPSRRQSFVVKTELRDALIGRQVYFNER
jgi:hypothetical protein